MSRGLGRTQRNALHLMHRDWPYSYSAGYLADIIYGHDGYLCSTPSQKAAMRRALAALARDGLVARDRQQRWRATLSGRSAAAKRS